MYTTDNLYTHSWHKVDLSHYKILVTGGAGFIGSNIVQYLCHHNAGEVRVLDNLSNGYKANIEPFFDNPGFSFVEGDIRNTDDCLEAVKDIDIILHQAALGSVPRSINDPMTSNNVNVGGLLNVLWAAKTNKVSRVVFASSSSVYGDHPDLPKVESNIGNPLSPYAVSKQAKEMYGRVFAQTYGMDIKGLRYFNIFGPGQSPKGPYAAVIPLFADACKNDYSPKIFGNGEQTRDFTFVANAVQANIKAAFAPAHPGEACMYNIACGTRTSLNTLLQWMSGFAEKNIQPEYDAPRAGDVNDSLADISKARKDLGYEPEWDVKEGLKVTYEWFTSHK